jgi:hypothetical protein
LSFYPPVAVKSVIITPERRGGGRGKAKEGSSEEWWQVNPPSSPSSVICNLPLGLKVLLCFYNFCRNKSLQIIVSQKIYNAGR